MNLDGLGSVLVLSPHTDDAELGCGGTISRLRDAGVPVRVAVFSSAQASVPAGFPLDVLRVECERSVRRLGVTDGALVLDDYPVRRFSDHRQSILDRMLELRGRWGPDLVLMPSGSDAHQDHQVVHAEGLRAFRGSSLWGYELPWNQVEFSAQAFVSLCGDDVRRKWEALSAYASQVSLGRRYFTREFVEGLARVRGVQVGSDWAEAFEVLRVRV